MVLAFLAATVLGVGVLLIPFISKVHKPYQKPIKNGGKKPMLFEATEPLNDPFNGG